MDEKFISQKDLNLYIAQRTLATTAAHIDAGMAERQATFDLYVREMPKNRNYMVFSGLEDVVYYLTNLRFSIDEISFLTKQFSLSEKVINYLKNFRFAGDVYAIPEGTFCFPHEPLIRITAPLAQLQILESVLFNIVGFQTQVATKMARLVQAAKPNLVLVGEQRAHGLESGLKALRAGKITGIGGTPLILAQKRFGSSGAGGVATHFFITSFPSEIEAFRAYLKSDPNGKIMVDTYDIKKGLENAITVAKELEVEGKKLKGIVIDSGDLVENFHLARTMLDEAGLTYVILIANSNLDEYKIQALKQSSANYDLFGLATEAVSISDSPTIEIVYKLAEIEENGQMVPKAKLSPQKYSLPGLKQVFRHIKDSQYCSDIIGLEDEKIDGEKLLIPILAKGKLVKALPNLDEIKAYTMGQYQKFSSDIFSLDKVIRYPVDLSPELIAEMQKISPNFQVTP